MRRQQILKTCGLISTTILFLALSLSVWAFSKFPEEAAKEFGPPGDDLGLLDQCTLSMFLILNADELNQPLDPMGVERIVEVSLGDSTTRITHELEAQGLIDSSNALRRYLKYSGLDKTLQAGTYKLSPRMTPIEIAHKFQDATPEDLVFQVLPGWRLEEIASAIPTSGLSFSPDSFIEFATDPPSIPPITEKIPPGSSLEGLLYPDSYLLPRQISVYEFVGKLLENFSVKVDKKLKQGYKNQGLDLYKAVILASIVQREAVVEDEMALIASVFLNRLAAGNKLDSDPTVQYSLGYNYSQDTWWTNPLSLKNLQFESPYNTYIYAGLPPGPIANPGLKALRAVAFPAQSPYYYFRATCDNSGRHNFAITYEDHLRNACDQSENQ